MADGDLIHVRGEGGAVFEMALPLPDPIQQRLAKGYLTRVNPDGSPYAVRIKPTEGPTVTTFDSGEGSDLTEGRPPKPDVNARKSEWVAYAVHVLGLSPDYAESRTKHDLIDLAAAQGEAAEHAEQG